MTAHRRFYGFGSKVYNLAPVASVEPRLGENHPKSSGITHVTVLAVRHEKLNGFRLPDFSSKYLFRRWRDDNRTQCPLGIIDPTGRP